MCNSTDVEMHVCVLNGDLSSVGLIKDVCFSSSSSVSVHVEQIQRQCKQISFFNRTIYSGQPMHQESHYGRLNN